MNKKALMENLVHEAHEKELFTGTWLFAEKGQIVSKGAIGWKDPEDTLPMLEDSIFDLASVSKQFTATAIMLLRKRGLLDLEDEITRFFPEIPYKGITIRHLLTHTAGLPDYMNWVLKTAENENTIPHNNIIIRFLCECGEAPAFAPGDKFEYSNTGYCLLAEIVEKASGIPFEEFMKKNIFEPAGMASTDVIHRRKDNVTIDNLACGMVIDFETNRYVLPDLSKDNAFVVPLDGASGDGLVHSTIFDLLTWDKAQREEKLLSKEEQALMYTSGRLNNGEVAGDPDDVDGYGFGWSICNDAELGLIVSHSGGWPGYGTWYERFVDADMVLVILRCRDQKDGRGYSRFFEGMRAIARGRQFEPICTIEDIACKNPDKSRWQALCGKYEHPKFDFILDEVFMKDGELYARFLNEFGFPYALKLHPLGENKFGVKKYSFEIIFNDGCVSYLEQNCKKL